MRKGQLAAQTIPHRLAEIATEGAIKNWQLGAERRQKRIEAELAQVRATAAKLEGVVLPFTKTEEAAFNDDNKIKLSVVPEGFCRGPVVIQNDRFPNPAGRLPSGMTIRKVSFFIRKKVVKTDKS